MPEASRGPREGPQSYPWAFQGPPEASRRHPGPKTIQSKKLRHLKILTERWSIRSLLICSAVPGAAAPQQGRSGGGGGGPSSCAFAWFLRGEVRGGGSPPGMSRETPRGKRKSQGRSRYCGIAQPSPEPGRHTDLREYCSIALTWAACGLEITGGVRGGGSPPGMGREAPKGKRKNQGRSRCFDVGGLWSGGAGAPPG